MNRSSKPELYFPSSLSSHRERERERGREGKREREGVYGTSVGETFLEQRKSSRRREIESCSTVATNRNTLEREREREEVKESAE